MKKKLLLGMAMLLSMAVLPSYGQETIFTTEVLNGWSGFTNNNVEDYYSGRWRVGGDSGYLGTSAYSEDENDSGSADAWLISPQIDITNKDSLKITIDHSYMFKGSSWGNMNQVLSSWVKLDDGDWIQFKISEYAESTKGGYSWSLVNYNYVNGVIDISSLHGHQLQFAFRLKYQGSYNLKWYIRSCVLTGITVTQHDEPVQISSFSEIKNLVENQLIEASIDSAWCHYNYRNKAILGDGTGILLLDLPLSNLYYHYNVSGTIKGRLTRRWDGLPELKAAYGDMVTSVREDYDDWDMNYKNVSISDYYDNLGTMVHATLDHVDGVIDDPFNNYNGITINTVSQKFEVCGIAYVTNDNRPRILVPSTLELYVILNDDVNIVYENIPNAMIRVMRRLYSGKWHTLCLPMSFNVASVYGEAALFESCDDGVMTFSSKTSGTIPAGTPFLYKSKVNNNYIYGENFTYVSPQTVNGGDYNFVGSLNPVQPADGTYYLSEGNTIKPLASGGTINAFRAYFEPASPNAAKARAISIDGMTTAIEDIVGGEELLGLPQKIYTVGGQYVGDDLDALPKGVYLVNGKKIIK